MTDLELVKAIAVKLEFEEYFFFPVDSDDLHDAECARVPPFVEILGRSGAETFLQSLIAIGNWKEEH